MARFFGNRTGCHLSVIRRAERFAKLSKLVYWSEDKIKLRLQKRFSVIRFFSGNSTQALGLVNKSEVILVIRGTESIEDVRKNLRFKKRDFLGIGRVHSGFLESLEEVLVDLVDFLKTYSENRKVWLTGHSLGGSVALCLAAYLQSNSGTVSGVYTFGSPKVFGWKTADIQQKLLGQKVIRFVNDKDIVARLPLYTMGFKHVGKVFFLRNDQLYTNISFLRRAFLVLRDIFLSFVILGWTRGFIKILQDSLFAHPINIYICRIRKHVNLKTERRKTNL